ncbi:MAG: glycosyltransferase [Terracidiphilus sp.]
MQPVSIIATELNEIGDIARVVESLLAQEPPAAEIIIVDGGSTDGTWEWLARAASRNPRLIAIRDETCSLKHSRGPVSRGRNVAIAAAKSPIIACADAGCTYAPHWMRNLTARIAAGQAEYALGGTCLDPAEHTVWDFASAPFFSVRLSPLEPTKSCTARSMAFTKDLWQRIGGFPENVLVGEDTFFDLEARRQTQPDFVFNAKALYRPLNTFRSACHQMKRYAISDGQAGVRWSRLFRNAARCVLELAALVAAPWALWPLLIVFLLEAWYAFHRDWRFLPRFGFKAILARFMFSLVVPWLVAVNQIRGRFSAKPLSNWQNQGHGTAS